MNFLKLGFTVTLSIAIILLVLACFFYYIHHKDRQLLKSIIHPQVSADNFIDTINHWVYQNQGFKKNQEFFLFSALGPTPIQVLQKGGDCADKSRLLMALLDAGGVDSTLVMLYDANNEKPTHTVVEIRKDSSYAIADPVFDIVFPKPNQEGYYGLKYLRENQSTLPNRLDELVSLRGSTSKIAYYDRVNETYQFARTINWEKNSLLQTVAKLLRIQGVNPDYLRRPHFLDDPKWFLALTSFITSLGFLLIAWLISLKINL